MSESNQNTALEISTNGIKINETVYNDTIKSPGKRLSNIGNTLLGAIEMKLFPMTKKVWNYDVEKQLLLQELQQKMQNVPKENIIQPPAYLAIPTLQKLIYTDDEKLREMFVNLLATSMNKETTNKAHPSFVEIISQITPDEAKLLKYLSTQEVFPKVDVIHYYLEDNELEILCKNISLFGEEAFLKNPEKTHLYFENFKRLGLLEIFNSRGHLKHSYADESVYQKMLDQLKMEFKEVIKILDTSKQELKFEKGRFEITDFGKLFLETVT